MKISNLKYCIPVALMGLGFSSCEDFLDRPKEDGYVVDQFYQSDEECYQGVNYLYSMPWNDMLQQIYHITEDLAGNCYEGGDNAPFVLFSVDGSHQKIRSCSEALWQTNAHCNTVYGLLKGAHASGYAKERAMGEALTLKALAYFYIVRLWGDVPLVHDNGSEIGAGISNRKPKVDRRDIYEYIVMTLEEAMRLLDGKKYEPGRIDYYSAEGLLAKVLLTRSGLGLEGSRNQDDLDAAARYAKDVIDNSGRSLLPNYEDNFKLEFNKNEEAMITLAWYGSRDPWTANNFLQQEVGMNGFDSYGQCWGDWTVPSADLQDAFGVSPMRSPEQNPSADTRRKATMMMPGDVYSQFWRNKGGFDYLRFLYDADYAPGKTYALNSGTGANQVKHLYGNSEDHYQGLGYYPQEQANGLATHLLRLSDIYLVYTEAVIGNNSSTSDASAIDAFYAVRSRAVHGATRPASVSFDDVWKERRLELAFEGDRWFDYVRRSYYDAAACSRELENQRRTTYYGLDDLYKTYYETGRWELTESVRYAEEIEPHFTVDKSKYTLPLPETDIVFNPSLMNDPVRVDVRSTYSY